MSTEYIKTNWQDGDIITAGKMNNIENGIKGLEQVGTELRNDVDDLADFITVAVGSPLVANTVAEMTDTKKIYVYTGSETGYINGNWYYYDGTNWQSGGAYNSTAVTTDKTLTNQDVPADAKAVGDQLTRLKADLTQLDGKIAATQITNTASGAIASFPDGADDVPVKDLTVQIEPAQNLHGQANPYPGGGGKNLLDPNIKLTAGTYYGLTLSTTDGYRYTLTGTATDSGSIQTSVVATEDAVILPAGTYYSKVGTLSLYKANGTWLRNQYSGVAFTVDEPFYIKNLYFEIVAGRVINDNNFLAIERGSTAPTAWSPYENICPITGWTGANVSRTGFNVWDEEWEVGNITNSGGNGGSTDRIRSKNYIPVLPSTVYCAVVPSPAFIRLAYYDANKTFISYVDTSTRPLNFITPSNCYYLRFNIGTDYGTTYNHDISINYPSTDTSYHTYKGGVYSVDWTTEAGTVYGGTLDVTSGVLTVDRKLVDLGNRNWSLLGNTGSRQAWVAYFSDIKPPVNGSTPYDAISSEFKGVSYNASWLPGVFAPTAASSATGVAFCVESGKYADASEFKEAVTGVQFCYAIAEPQTYQLTPTEVSTLLGLNNIWADTGDVEVEYRADTKLYIEKLTAPSEDDMVANTNIPDATYFMVGNTLYLSTTTIPAGDTINPGTNCTLMNLAAALNAINS